MTGTLWKLGGILAAGIAGLTMVFWALERTTLIDAAIRLDRDQMAVPRHVYVTLFVGLTLLYLSVYFALVVWSTFLKANPTTKQIPIWVLVVVIVVSGGAGLTGFAQHSGYLRSLEAIPMVVNQGYVAYQVVAAAVVVTALVLLGVRWAPGYRMSLAREH